MVDPEEPTKPMGDGAEGQVMVTVLTRDLFVPPTLERDLATRHTPSGDGGIEVWGVRPGTTAHHTAIEGVY